MKTPSRPVARVAPRGAVPPPAKRDELKTYRELELGRDLKSQARRRRIEARGVQRVIGDGSTGQPHLIVDAKRYRQVRLDCQRRLLLEARALDLGLDPDRLLAQVAPRVEALAYVQLAEERREEAARHLPVAALGRALTREERASFADTSALAVPRTGKMGPSAAGTALEQVLGRIEKRQAHNPARYQTIWAQLVGSEIAAQTRLERVDPATQIAYFRCVNSVVSMDLQRRPGLPQKLAQALGRPVRQLRAQF